MNIVAADLERHRVALAGHCYRMLGSSMDAEDAVQETLLRAWRSREGFDGRSALHTWLYRIATNVCLDTLGARRPRVRPSEEGPPHTIADELVARPRTHWLEPVPDARVIPSDADPAAQAMLRQSIRLAFVAALQHLPARQRAALLLTEVLGWSVAEVAEALETSVAAMNSALQRARATLETRDLGEARAELTPGQRAVVDRYFEAFERYDVDALARLLTDDARLSMPPYSMWLQGPEAISAWLLGRGAGCRGSRILPTQASGLPAFAQYRDGGREPWALAVLELRGEAISATTFFLDVDRMFPLFGAPAQLA